MARPRKRRWTQFGVGTLLLIVAAFAIWFGRAANLARQQRQAIHLIEELGGTIVFDHAYDGSDEPPAPEWLRQFLGEEYFRRVQGVAIVSEDLTDDHLEELAGLFSTLMIGNFLPHEADTLTQSVQSDRYSSPVTDVGLQAIARISTLTDLDLMMCRETQEQLAEFARQRPDVKVTGGTGYTKVPPGYSYPNELLEK
jgi:hypothetical protein